VICLNDDWRLHSSAGLTVGGEELSTPKTSTEGWYKATVPATVLGTLVEAGVYPDPFFGMNLREIPGQGPFAQNFSNHAMPKDSPFAVSWWFRREFRVPKGADRVVLAFDGVNYRANVWVNGKQIAYANQVVGSYRGYEFDVSEIVDRNGVNVMALEIEAPTSCELALTWVDWNPSPPDKNMGIWKDVWLYTSGSVALREPHVVTKLKGVDADLTVGGDIVNLTNEPVQATVKGKIDGKSFSAQYELKAKETRRFDIDASQCPELAFKNPKLWWPRMMGEPNMYDLDIEVVVGGESSDAQKVPFGIREVKGELNKDGWTQYFVNGQPLVIRGAGWATDLFLRRMPEKDFAQIEFVKQMNLNTIRFEGMLERREFLEKCDREGIIIIAGWCCCDCWEKWEKWGPENHFVAGESLRTYVRRVRRHPSLLTWWYGSDFPPPESVEALYLKVFDEERWPNSFQSSAADKPTPLTGRSGLKMLGPYEYVPPNYWLEDTHRGGAWGFATEVCPGPAIPPIQSLKKMLPKENLWPVDDVWNYHAGGQEFHQVRHFEEAVKKRLGDVNDVETFAHLSQLICYEAQRSMFEAYVKARPKATGVVQWMLNNAWPSLIWHLYDYYLRTGGGFFGTKKACEPLHVFYADDEQAVFVNNDTLRAVKGVRVTARLFDTKLAELYTAETTLDVPANGVIRALALPERATLSELYFADLRLTDAQGKELDNNLYWLPKKLDVLDHEKNFWIHTPVAENGHSDISALRSLEPAEVETSCTRVDERTLRMELKNSTAKLAFFMELRLADGKGEDVLPVVYSDNYLSLVPGESRSIEVKVLGGQLPADGKIEIAGINVAKRALSFEGLAAAPKRTQSSSENRPAAPGIAE